ncbi:MAG TPA: (Fe-S)-binding protein [Clostridiaceae bacterium]|nr:(Fe-S)-binding protein [Clostridiaceae bacterium]
MNYLNTKNHYDNCRFCWMCRQVCTVATMTNDETQSPRSRGLALYAAEKDIIKFDEPFAEAMYKCCLCDYCRSWCKGNYDPQEFILAARRDSVDLNIEPKHVKDLKNTLMEWDNVYSSNISDEFKNLWASLPDKGDVLLLAGGVIPFKAVEIAKAALSVFNKLGIKVAGVNEVRGTYELYSLGYYNEAYQKALDLIEQLKSTGAKTIVALDTQERYFLSNLNEIFGLKLEARVLDFSEFVEEAGIRFSNGVDNKVVYHDDSFLSRKCDNTESPRKILASVPGTELIEMLWYKKEAHATPNALYSSLCPNIADKMLLRIINEFAETGADAIIVSAANDYVGLKQAGVNVYSLAEFVDKAL